MTHDFAIFDRDGVLIDSEVLAVRADVACLAEEGIAISAGEIIERYVGISVKAKLANLEARLGCPLGDDFAARHVVRFAALCEAEHRAVRKSACGIHSGWSVSTGPRAR
jgi:beta-phosphoglucomutase-like phosphatase (HAD superfamily)